MTREHYILDEKHEPKVVPLLEWAQWFDTAERHVAQDRIGESRVSTVFLGIDHNFGLDGPPLLFETMIFGGPLAEEQWRYTTWGEAEKGHAHALELVRAKVPQ